MEKVYFTPLNYGVRSIFNLDAQNQESFKVENRTNAIVQGCKMDFFLNIYIV